MHMSYISKEIKGLMVSIFILAGLFFSSAVFGAGALDFGGNIATVVQCTCSPGSQVAIVNTGRNAQFNGTYLYSPATMVRGKGNVVPGRQILGKYSPGGECLMTAVPKCIELPITKGTMKMIGTN